jgi:U3 small nucleolar RNA-associated protein 21
MREHVWDNIACMHRDSPLVSTWSSRRYTKGTHLFCHDRFTKNGRYLDANVTAIEITNSGDFCFVGYSSGHIDAYNMESGLYKFSFENPKLKSMPNVCYFAIKLRFSTFRKLLWLTKNESFQSAAT